MNRKKILQQSALATLLMAAVAAPLTAHAAAPAEDTAKPVKVMRMIMADGAAGVQAFHQRPDPVGLAETYAPDTVQEWKNTLDQFQSLAGIPGQKAILLTEGALEGAAVTETVTVHVDGVPLASADETSLPAAETIRVQPAAPADPEGKPIELTPAASAGSGNIIFYKTISAIPAETAEEKEAVMKDGETDVVGAVQVIQAGITAALPKHPFADAELKLVQAAESKDAESIRTALADLLKIYKEEIAVLEKNVKPALPAE